MGRRCVHVVLGIAAVLSWSGCLARRGADVTYHDPNMDFSTIGTVAVMPFGNLTGNAAAGEAVRDVFMTMLQATGTLYVLPPGEVARGISRLSIRSPEAPTPEELTQLADIVKADVIVTGTVTEYGELRSGSSAGGVVSASVKMIEAQSGKVVWSASASEGGVSLADRMFGGGGRPMDEVTRRTVTELLDRLFE